MSALIDAILAELASDPAARTELRDALAVADDQNGGRLLTPTEAAQRLGITYDTLIKAARAGRVPGAHKAGVKLWRFRERELELLPVPMSHLGAAGAGRPRRPARPSSTVQAISGKAAA
jgi:excisionase family DNA binding protein